jgi:predicted molibdopterin-dependent oxidoreductase YjgC
MTDRACLRITDHPILDDLGERREVTLFFQGKEIRAYEGETVAAALYAAGIKVFRYTPEYMEPRGVFCNRGRCTDCIMRVDGKPNVRTCVTLVRDGMKVEPLKGLGRWGE